MVCVDLEGRSCLVVGAGAVGLEKARGLVECGARVTVVAPEAGAEIGQLPVRWLPRPYESSDLEGRFLVVAATSLVRPLVAFNQKPALLEAALTAAARPVDL